MTSAVLGRCLIFACLVRHCVDLGVALGSFECIMCRTNHRVFFWGGRALFEVCLAGFLSLVWLNGFRGCGVGVVCPAVFVFDQGRPGSFPVPANCRWRLLSNEVCAARACAADGG